MTPRPPQPIDLVLHDWMKEERQQALADVRALADSHTGDQRRGRALHVIASFFHFFTASLHADT